MSVKKAVLFIISCAILGLGAFALLQTAKHPKLSKIRVAFKDRAGTFFDNLLVLLASSTGTSFGEIS